MFYERVSDSPNIASKNYIELSDAITPNEDNEWTWMEYTGRGIEIAEHPLRERLNMHGCANCSSDNVLVIYAKWCVSTASGDAYWDYEIVCTDCTKFTARSFSEND